MPSSKSILVTLVVGAMLVAAATAMARLDERSKPKTPEEVDVCIRQARDGLALLVTRLSDDDKLVRHEAAACLKMLLADVQRGVEDGLKPNSDGRLSVNQIQCAKVLGEIHSTRVARDLVWNISFEDRELYVSEWDPLLDYPYAKALREMGMSSATEIIHTAGNTPPEQTSDKDIELMAHVLKGVYGLSNEPVLVLALQIEKSRCRSKENMDRLLAKLSPPDKR